ncbi:MAG: radical SAM protein [Candidatus Margulisiibacteriota bacterium]|jgi:MoaA/NifB/PqqE/SkfB family radical SAM enzyme
MNTEYFEIKKLKTLPRLPLAGKIDLTYRCNNNCRHCWLWLPQNDLKKNQELNLEEIKKIVDDGKKLGCRQWSISGGEPMIRPDFTEIFDYITSNSISYSINTNGTLVTSKIAQLLKRKGTKMVSLYGATAKVHDHITRNPGSFEATMRGFTYLKEAGASFIVQIVPIKDNYHQFNQMIDLAKSLSKHYRIGAAWLYLTENGDPVRNEEIKRQRLNPKEVIALDKPNVSFKENIAEENTCVFVQKKDNRLFALCINNRRDFHIDPFGKTSSCGFIKSPDLRYDLRKGTLADAWDNFIPSITNKIYATKEYEENCDSCESRKDCRWCPVYGYLEHRDFSKKVDYLCEVAKENKKYKENWQKNHRAYYQTGGITIQIDSDLPITENTFHQKMRVFQKSEPGEDTVFISHHFELPDLNEENLGQRVYYKAPWSIYKKGDNWIYLGISPTEGEKDLHRIAVFNRDHSRGKIYHPDHKIYQKGKLSSLTLFPTDQILLARLLADRGGCYLHSCGIVFNNKGLLFVGHSTAGKSTTSLMLKAAGGKILCDDRIIVKKHNNSFDIHGTWSHGDVKDIAPDSAPLQAILFLEKSDNNEIIPLTDKKEIIKKLLACIIKPFETADWWEKELAVLEQIIQKIPFYRMQFDKSGKIVEKIKILIK